MIKKISMSYLGELNEGLAVVGVEHHGDLGDVRLHSLKSIDERGDGAANVCSICARTALGAIV